MVPFDAVEVPVVVEEAVVVEVAVAREEPVGAPVGDGALLSVESREPNGEALRPAEGEGVTDAESAREVEALPLSCADAVDELDTEGLLEGTLADDADGDAVLAAIEALAQPLLEGGAAVALTVALTALLEDSH